MTPQGLAATKDGQLELKNSKIVQTLLKKHEANPLQAVDTEEILGTAAGLAFADGSAAGINRLAQEVAYIYQSQRKKAYTNLEPQRVGMILPEKVIYTYDQPLLSNTAGGTGVIPGFAEPSMQVDLTNPTEVKNLLLRINANNKLRNASNVLGQITDPIRDIVAPRMQDYRRRAEGTQGGQQ